MLRQIGQWLVKLWQRFRGIFRKRQVLPSQALTDAERERLFLQLLDVVDKFGQTDVLRCVETLKQRCAEAEWVAWLQKFGERLLESPAPNRQLAQRMVKLGEVGCGELGEIARAIGTQLLGRELQQGGEAPTTEINAEAVVYKLTTALQAILSQPGKEVPTTEINAEAEAWLEQGFDQYQKGDVKGALDCLKRAISLKSDFFLAWHGKGAVLSDLRRYQEALDCYDRAIALESNFHHAWSGKGNVLRDLGRYQEALDCYERAISLKSKSDFLPAWHGKGNVLSDLRRYQEALDCFDRAIDLQSNFHPAWNGKGNVLRDLGRYQQALECFDRAIALESDFHIAWNGKGLVLRDLGRYEEALECYERAISRTPKSDFHIACNNKGLVLWDLGRYEEAIIAFNRALQLTDNQHWQAWANRGLAVFDSPLRGYEAAIENWDEGLRAIQSIADPEANASLHQRKGDAHYRHGRLQSNPYTFWREGKLSYLEALKCLVVKSDASPKTSFLGSHDAFGTLRAPKLRQLYLQILKDLATVCSALGSTDEALGCSIVGEKMLKEWLQEITLEDYRTKLVMEFATFHQLQVDLLARSPEPKQQIEALELAEARKNLCLRWLRQGWSDEPPDSPNYKDIQRELLNPHTAAIYWHLSANALTTFILTGDAAPQLSILRDFHLGATVKLHEFDNWMKRWKTTYQVYRKDAKEATTENKEQWREEMLTELEKLAKYLNIPGILATLQNLPQPVTELILIPHRDLHLLPLEYLFRDSPFSLTRLPSAQTGMELQKSPTSTERHLLSIENPSTTKPLRYSEIEAVAVSQLYDASQDNRIRGQEANKENVIIKLETAFANVLLFTGHGYHKPNAPLESGLVLANDRPLTLRDIFEVKFAKNYYLVCLSACETGLTSQANLLDEFIGLASGFLAKRSLYVVATLWTVKEISAAFLMIEFHRSLVLEKKAPPVALKQAQTWLRTVCDRDLAIWCCDRATEIYSRDRKCSDHLKTQALKIEEELKNDIMKSSQCRYSHPYYWAGFAIAGKIN